ncbi:MAG TPA: glycogen debranching N-terminal domain-containing protein [Vicinamibacterales bacterium]|jgi:glycogen debranching enzyme|nr:glycogen debranching N-terminal domain-containing protein [Vicinamibacterales bacterium]
MSPTSPTGSLVTLRPAGDQLHLHVNRLVLATGLDGFVRGGTQGLFAYEARVLSEYRYLVDEQELLPVGVSPISARASLGYYVAFPPGRDRGRPDQGSGLLIPDTQHTLELIVRRRLMTGRASKDSQHATTDWIDERIHVRNYSDARTAFLLRVAIDADFRGLPEVRQRPLGLGRVERRWHDRTRELVFEWRAHHAFTHDGEAGMATDHRGMRVAVKTADGPLVGSEHGLAFSLDLAPGGSWSARLRLRPGLPDSQIPVAGSGSTVSTVVVGSAPRGTTFEAPGDQSRSALVTAALDRARTDLEGLRLNDLDRGASAWTMAAGVPIYVALFGRDTLTASWQAAMVTPDMMRGTLQTLACLQGRHRNDWRDEAPGRFLHEAHTGPLETLNVNPRSRYYGSVTTSGFFPAVLSAYWHWTGDEELVRALVPHALDGLRWLDDEGDLDGDGFVEYHTRSSDGVKHQGWKDSGDAIVYPDGSPVEPPIATCEEQAFVYVAKLHLTELLWRLGERREARRLLSEARRLRRRFNQAFWIESTQFLAMALDADKRPVTTIGSNAGHCLAAGIVRREHVRAVADRLFAPDLFSGWGIRTLSSEHPAFNPYSYHRGSVWPVEQGSFALGLVRYGLFDHLDRLARGLVDATAVFEHGRLPELFSGHPRDAQHPFPALYPQANAPQAWSASTLFLVVQSILGLYPYAPSHLLFIDPHLPRWLPALTVRNLQVGEAVVTIEFRRGRRETAYKVLEQRGPLHIIRQASPWSLTEPVGRRLRVLAGSLLKLT